MATYHRPGCLLLRDKPTSPVTAADIASKALTPCPVCAPEPPRHADDLVIGIDLALAGIAVGAVAALAGLGVLVTYRTTGVFNLASGGMAMLVAYVLWQLVRGWHWPLWIAAPIALLVVGPGLGLAAECGVFRPLRRRSASTAETLVASVGMLVLLLGLAAQIWGLQARQDAPSLVPSGPVDLPGGATIDRSSLAQLAHRGARRAWR